MVEGCSVFTVRMHASRAELGDWCVNYIVEVLRFTRDSGNW